MTHFLYIHITIFFCRTRGESYIHTSPANRSVSLGLSFRKLSLRYSHHRRGKLKVHVKRLNKSRNRTYCTHIFSSQQHTRSTIHVYVCWRLATSTNIWITLSSVVDVVLFGPSSFIFRVLSISCVCFFFIYWWICIHVFKHEYMYTLARDKRYLRMQQREIVWRFAMTCLLT